MIYLDLYHGRESPEENLDDWGFNGPVLGPFDVAQITYWSTFRLLEPDGNDIFADYYEDLLHYDGVFYGDCSIVSVTNVRMQDAEWKARLKKPEEARFTIPPMEVCRCRNCGYKERLTPAVLWLMCPCCGRDDKVVRKKWTKDMRVNNHPRRVRAYPDATKRSSLVLEAACK